MNWFDSAKEILAKWKAREASAQAFYEKFTPRAKRALVFAGEEAKRLNHNFIGTEHILLGLIKLKVGVAINVLGKLGLNLDMVRMETEKMVGRGPDAKAVSPIPFTPRAKTVIEIAKKEAAQLNHTYIGTEHLLLAILRENRGTAVRVLWSYNVNTEQLHKEIVSELISDDNPQKE